MRIHNRVFPRAEPGSASLELAGCKTIELGAGIIKHADGSLAKIDELAEFVPSCKVTTHTPTILGATTFLEASSSTTSSSTIVNDPTVSDFRDPFYASTFPQCYALAATTVVAYTLVIMLMIAPRSFLDRGVVVLGKRGFTNGPNNNISIGERPWLQKVAALTVAISLTIATVDTFRVAEQQYASGIQNAAELQRLVLGGTQLKVIRLVSDTFLWLAQAQTLIRLFPRQREKIIIKWTAFSLITLDVIFEALNSFQYDNAGTNKPQTFTDAVPALSYLFQLALGLLYAAWVIYYSLMKKRYAYYHPLMRNICLMAMLSIIAILVPVVFFILDISKPDFTGWGDYVRWVGAAAASVVVWEWVERIEALEREEKKDGILGREVFDGDEMMDLPPSDFAWPRRRKTTKKPGDSEDDDGFGTKENDPQPQPHTLQIHTHTHTRPKMWPAMSTIATRYLPKHGHAHTQQHEDHSVETSTSFRIHPPLWPRRPVPVATPISRTDTASAASTIYAVRYQPLTETTSRTTTTPPEIAVPQPEQNDSSPIDTTARRQDESQITSPPLEEASSSEENRDAPTDPPQTQKSWQPFALMSKSRSKSKRRAPPAEVLAHTEKEPVPQRDYEKSNRWDLKGRMEDFAATKAEKIREKMRPSPDTDSLPVTVIPAPPRRGATLARLLDDDRQNRTPGNTISEPDEEPILGQSSPGGSNTWQGTSPTLFRQDEHSLSTQGFQTDGSRSDLPLRGEVRQTPATSHQGSTQARRPVDEVVGGDDNSASPG